MVRDERLNDGEIERRTDVIVQLTTLRHENNRFEVKLDRQIDSRIKRDDEEERNKSTNMWWKRFMVNSSNILMDTKWQL